jgi:hypothetical protein
MTMVVSELSLAASLFDYGSLVTSNFLLLWRSSFFLSYPSVQFCFLSPLVVLSTNDDDNVNDPFIFSLSGHLPFNKDREREIITDDDQASLPGI